MIDQQSLNSITKALQQHCYTQCQNETATVALVISVSVIFMAIIKKKRGVQSLVSHYVTENTCCWSFSTQCIQLNMHEHLFLMFQCTGKQLVIKR